jgi:hypothetical protein
MNLLIFFIKKYLLFSFSCYLVKLTIFKCDSTWLYIMFLNSPKNEHTNLNAPVQIEYTRMQLSVSSAKQGSQWRPDY